MDIFAIVCWTFSISFGAGYSYRAWAERRANVWADKAMELQRKVISCAEGVTMLEVCAGPGAKAKKWIDMTVGKREYRLTIERAEADLDREHPSHAGNA